MDGVADGVTTEESIDPSLIHVDESDQHFFALRLADDRMTCLAELNLSPEENEGVAPFQISPPELIWILIQNNIHSTIDYEGLYQFCADVELGHAEIKTVVACGCEPVKGDDGWFELMVKTSGEERAFVEDETGKVDLKTLNAYSEIESGQKLGMVHSPKKGTPGWTVLGAPIAAEPGDPYVLIGGEGVELRYDNRVAFATKAGRALFEKNILAVVDQLVIPGDLDLSVGNIDFNGFVEICGEVPDDFFVKATKGILIKGLVGACQLESNGSIELTSMAGKDCGRIDCHGDLKAGFLNQVTAAVYGNVVVSSEIRNSYVKATGAIIVENGSIIGGRCTAMEGIEAKTLGTTSGQKTQIIAGVFFPDVDRFVYLREQLLSVNRQIEAINEGLIPLKKYIERHPACGETSQKRLQILSEKLEHLTSEKERFSAEIASSQVQQFDSQNPKINVHKALMEGASIVLGDSSEVIRQQRTGPLSIIENSESGGLRYLDMSPLSVFARDIEGEISLLINEES